MIHVDVGNVRAPLACSVVAMARLFFVIVLFAAPMVHAQGDPLARAAELTRNHSDEAALAAMSRLSPSVQRQGRTRYLRARLLDRLARYSDAAAAYPTGADAAALPDPVRQDAIRRRAIALLRVHRCGPARELLGAAASDPVIEARLAECALASGDLASALTQLRTVTRRRSESIDLFAAQLQLAQALVQSGERDEAIEILTALVVERPDHPEAEAALTLRRELRASAAPELTFDQHMRRAERFYEVRRYDESLRELEATGRPRRRPELRRWLHVYGMSLYDERQRYEDAARVLAESAALDGAFAADDQFHSARALSRADRDADAVAAYRRFALDHPEHAKAPEALYLAAWLELRRGMRGADRRMQRFLRSALAQRVPELAREASWLIALGAFERGQHTRAATLFTTYAESHGDVLVRARGLYWTGRARHAAGDRARAIRAYRDAMRVEPLHWYALLARQRLLELGEDPGPPFADAAEAGEAPGGSMQLPEEVRFYAALGLRNDARQALEPHEAALRSSGDDGLYALVSAYAELDEPARVRRLVTGAGLLRRQAQPGPRDRWLWDALYPRPWRDRVRTAASGVGLTPAHLYSIMWQESGFNPDAVSYADAIGLMQLLPSTATRVAEQNGLSFSREMLFDPGTNIRLGASYVGGLCTRFGVPLCFAAFNAGGHRVEQWLAQQGETDLDLFVERIPYAQTRNYVRRVTTHLAHYQYFENPARGWPFSLPARVAP